VLRVAKVHIEAIINELNLLLGRFNNVGMLSDLVGSLDYVLV